MESMGTDRTLLPNHFILLVSLPLAVPGYVLLSIQPFEQLLLHEGSQRLWTRRFGWLHHCSPPCSNAGTAKDPEYAGNVHSSKTGTFKTGTFKTGTFKTRCWFTLFLSSHNSCWREQVVHLREVILFQTPASVISSTKHSFGCAPSVPQTGFLLQFHTFWNSACFQNALKTCLPCCGT